MSDEPGESLKHRAIYGDLSAAEARVIGRALFTYGWRIATLATVLWMLGTFKEYGLGGGFAYAGEVDQKIAAAIEPVAKEQKEQRQVLETLSRQLNEQLANGVASEIRNLVGRRCSTPKESPERDRLQREIDRKQDEYEALRKSRYPFGCPDL